MGQNLLELNRDVLRGTSKGKIIFQPRILCWSDDKRYLNEPLPGGLDGLTDAQIYKNLGCSNRIYEYSASVRQVLPKNVHTSIRDINPLEREITVETPVGKLVALEVGNTSNPGRYYKKWPVTCEDNLKVAMWLIEHTEWEFDQSIYDNLFAEWGNLGLPVTGIWPRVNVLNLFNDIMGVEGAIYALMDYRNTVEKYFIALEEATMRQIEVINKSPIEWVNYGDNLHGGVLSPKLFEKYVLPAYQRRGDRLHKANKFTFSHWDGDCKVLLPYAKNCELDGIEAITPQPQGDVTLDEMKEALGDEIFLIDGIAAILFNDDYPVEALVEQVNRIIELFAPKLVLGISDEMPSNGNIERVRLVKEMVDNYNNNVRSK